jgi:sigma-54 dependent transcriptional regulator, acetoin dehydrogenase operon transcriptional activator AcoR
VSRLSSLSAAHEVRPEIRRSWERSAQCGLDPGSALNLPYEPDIQAEERFLRAATPVLDHVGSFLEGSNTSAVLTDPRGRLLARRCPDNELARLLDRTNSLPGFTWSEEYSGTTALSLAVEERMPAWVGPGEHYLEALSHLVCAAVPIVHPITQRVQGVIDVTAAVNDASRHMMPVVLQAARAIEERLYEDASGAERALLSHFLSAAHHGGRPIVVLGERVELSTPSAARLLDVGDKTLLWERASGLIQDHHTADDTFTLTDGREVSARFVRIEVEGRPTGVVIELDVPRAAAGKPAGGDATAPGPRRSPSTAPVRPASPFRGRSSASQYLRDQAAALAQDLMPILVTGEAGTGKLTLAKAIAGEGSQRVLIDAARTTIDGEDVLLRQLASVADSPGKTIIVRRIGCLSEKALQALIAIATAAEANSSRVIATATSSADPDNPGVGGLAEAFGLKLEVPPLRERVDDLLDLVPYLIERRGATARMAPAAIQTLMRYDWPGNVRELDGLVRALLTRKRTTDIVIADLPPGYQRGSRRLRRIEQVERSAIVQALLEVGGNRTKAAELLEIGRATLYRKIRAYGLDLDLSTS